ncbi:hypothetical protein Vretimale_17391 [Volvox reticuliferus]|uniref:DUF676 domain-containing protein n=2 Tax=Volvox reticuliferus TaxID=1737510 RepID=A0A8J4LYB6_9CHLO|nr:hypothetical protein Vretimale_17391 [Volvox reticuliferus]
MERWWESPPEPKDTPTGTHLFVCQHGLWGSPEDVSFLEQYLRHNGWLTLNARSNSARCTFDGADVCGDRLAEEVVSHVQRLAAGGLRVTHISFAAYSFGGLIARYAAGKLHASGFFSLVTPVNFLTIATPHLGCWEHPSSMSHLAYNNILPWTLSRTGRQLLLADRWLEPEGLPLLATMARPDCAFHAALATFRKRVLLADIRSDRTVPYTTAAITAVNPYLPGGAAAAAPYAAPPPRRVSRPPSLAVAASVVSGQPRGCGCRPGCGCGCGCGFGHALSQGSQLMPVPLHEGDEDEETEGGGGDMAADAEVDADSDPFVSIGLGGVGGLFRGCGNLMGLGLVLNVWLSVTSLLFGGATSGSSHARSRGRGRAACWSGVRGQSRLAWGCRCGCRGCGCCNSWVRQRAPAMIPLPISSAYPCIVTPHPAAAAAATSGVGGRAAAACAISHGSRHRPSTVTGPSAAPPPGMHRSVSSPLPGLRPTADSSSDGCSGLYGGYSGSKHDHFQASGTAIGRRTAQGPPSRQDSGLRRSFFHRLGFSGSSASANTNSNANAVTDRQYYSLSNMYGNAGRHRYQPRQRRWYETSCLPATASSSPSSLSRYTFSSATLSPSAMRNGRAGVETVGGRSSWSDASANGGSGGDEGSSNDDALASRVRMGLFVALLPVLLSLWLCMVAWLAAIWIHHYAVLLTVRPDRSWDVRLQQPEGAEQGMANQSVSATGGGGDAGDGGAAAAVTAVTTAEPAADAAGGSSSGTCDDDASRGLETIYDSSELAPGSELLVSLTEAKPPPAPTPPLLLQRRRLSCVATPMQPTATVVTDASAADAIGTPAVQTSLMRHDAGDSNEGGTVEPPAIAPLSLMAVPPVEEVDTAALAGTSKNTPHSSPAIGSLNEVAPGLAATSAATSRGALEMSAGGRQTHGTCTNLASALGALTNTAITSTNTTTIPITAADVAVAADAISSNTTTSVPADAGAPAAPDLAADPEPSAPAPSVAPARVATASGGEASAVLDYSIVTPDMVKSDTWSRVNSEVRESMVAAVTAAAAAVMAPDVPMVADAEASAASLLVRSVVKSIVQRHDGGSSAAALPIPAGGRQAKAESLAGEQSLPLSTVDSEAALLAAGSDAIEFERCVVRDLTRLIFRSVLLRHVTARTASCEDTESEDLASIDPSSATAATQQRQAPVHDSGGGGAAAATAQPIDLSDTPAAACCQATNSPALLLLDKPQQQQGKQLKGQHCSDHAGLIARGSDVAAVMVDGDPAAVGSDMTSVEPNVRRPAASGSSVLQVPMRAPRSSPCQVKNELLPQEGVCGDHLRRHVGGGAASATQQREVLSSPPSSTSTGNGSLERRHDPAALLAEMIANLNQLEWQKVDVDTRHYHAHAAIVVRSSRRFRSHMHIIDYAIRQLHL